jgi:hypothetical protein
MASIWCPFCRARTNFSNVYTETMPATSRFNLHGRTIYVAALRCNNEECTVVIGALVDKQGTVLKHFPEMLYEHPAIEDVPEHLARAAEEAHNDLAHEAYRSATILARAVVEATAKEVGITTGKLVAKIDEMEKRGLIRELVKDSAHEIRYLGNDMAHGDFVDPVTAEEAEEIVGLMDEVLEEVFQAPARLARRKNARLAKKTPVSP